MASVSGWIAYINSGSKVGNFQVLDFILRDGAGNVVPSPAVDPELVEGDAKNHFWIISGLTQTNVLMTVAAAAYSANSQVRVTYAPSELPLNTHTDPPSAVNQVGEIEIIGPRADPPVVAGQSQGNGYNLWDNLKPLIPLFTSLF